jgi:LysM repeat protein
MAVFLAIGGLLSGLIWSSLFVGGAGIVQERRIPGGPELIPQAEGAEVDSAALTPQSAPFLASINGGAAGAQLAENIDVLYGAAALKDPERVIKTKTAAPTHTTGEAPVSGTIYQTVVGDTLKSISAAFNVPIDTIVEFNPSVNFSSLSANAFVVIPSQKDVSLLAH